MSTGMWTCVCPENSGQMLIFTFSHQWTPLYVAADRGTIDMVRYFGDKGADVNVKTWKGVSK